MVSNITQKIERIVLTAYPIFPIGTVGTPWGDAEKA
jgi:hypothetical protein